MGVLGSKRSLLSAGLSSRPSWSWSPAASASKPPGAAFARASAASYYNSSGTMVLASTDVPRFDYDPFTLLPLGYLSEMQSTNLALRSEDFTTTWSNNALAVTANQVVAPDGNTTADKVLESTAVAVSHIFWQNIVQASGVSTGVSLFIKPSSRTSFYLNIQGGSNHWVSVVFDLTTGLVSQTGVGATSGTLESAFVRAIGNGWFRVHMVAKISVANPAVVFGFCPLATGNTLNAIGEIAYTGDGVSFAYFWGAQIETGGVGVTSYIATTAATVTRAQDQLSLPASMLTGWNPRFGGVFAFTYQVAVITPTTPGFDQIGLFLSDGPQTNFVEMTPQAAGNMRARTKSGGVQQLAITSNNLPPLFTRRRQAIGWGPAQGTHAYNGITIADSGPALLPIAPTTLNLGWINATNIVGWIESVDYYPKPRSSNFVKSVSVLPDAPFTYRFNSTPAMPSGTSDSRASSGTRFNSAGLLVTETNDVGRFTYDPLTLALQGLLVEPPRTNSFTTSNSTATFSLFGRCTATNNIAVAPDGTTTGARVIEDTSVATSHYLGKATTTANGATVWAVRFKRLGTGANRNFQIQAATTASFQIAVFNIDTMTASLYQSGGGGITSPTAGIAALGNGWYLGWLQGTVTDGGAGQSGLYTGLALGNSADYTGDGVSGGYFWGWTIEAGVGVSSYIATSGSAVTRAGDTVPLPVPSGTYIIATQRQSGLITLTGQVITGSSYTVPQDTSALQSVSFSRTA